MSLKFESLLLISLAIIGQDCFGHFGIGSLFGAIRQHHRRPHLPSLGFFSDVGGLFPFSGLHHRRHGRHHHGQERNLSKLIAKKKFLELRKAWLEQKLEKLDQEIASSKSRPHGIMIIATSRISSPFPFSLPLIKQGVDSIEAEEFNTDVNSVVSEAEPVPQVSEKVEPAAFVEEAEPEIKLHEGRMLAEKKSKSKDKAKAKKTKKEEKDSGVDSKNDLSAIKKEMLKTRKAITQIKKSLKDLNKAEAEIQKTLSTSRPVETTAAPQLNDFDVVSSPGSEDNSRLKKHRHI